MIRPTDLRCESQVAPLCVGTPEPRFSWSFVPSADRGFRQAAYQIRVGTRAGGPADLWDSGRVESADTVHLPYAGVPLRSARQVWWQVGSSPAGESVQWSDPATFTTGILHPADWRASWIGADLPEGAMGAPLFRRTFHVDKPLDRAIAYVCGLGHFDLRVNGSATSDDLFAPGWTDYDKTCLYVARDLTPLLRPGDNALAVTLGNGMYRVIGKRYKKFKRSYDLPKLLLQLHLRYADGSEEELVSDATWRTAAGGTTFNCIYGGEDFDARQSPRGWDAVGFDDAHWTPATVVDPPAGTLRADVAPPVRVMQTYQPKAVTTISPDVVLYDMGQNLSGFPDLTMTEAAGATVKLVTGELLDDAGRVTQKRTGSPVYYQCTSDGTPGLRWRPTFAYTGYRYVEAQGDVAAVAAIESCFVHSAAPVVGHFACSSALLNRIHELILAAVRSNLQSVMTDCPHREKLGWLEQTHLMGPAVMMNFDVSGLYAKIGGDVRDAQYPDGCVPTIAPEYVVFKDKYAHFSNSPEWGIAAIVNPWLSYQQYGDVGMLRENYDVMRRYAAYLHGREDDGIVAFGLGDWYDIGPGDPGYCKLTTPGVTGTAVAYLGNRILADTARLLGDPAADYDAHAERLKAAFHRRFFNAGRGFYDTGSQTAQAMPLALGMVPDAERARVLAHLIADVRGRDNHITAGDVGFRFVLSALADAGRSDVILDLLQQTTPPSYGCQLDRGATTLTEAWDANPINSQNHLMLGHAELWFHRHLAGIQLDLSLPPDQRIVIAPAVVGELTFAEATHDSALGRIGVRWDRHGNALRLAVRVPPNQSAVVCVPTAAAESVTEGGKPVANRTDLSVLSPTSGLARVRVGSGSYLFDSRLALA